MVARSRRRMEDGRELVSRFKESGLTQKAFAQDEGIGVCLLQYWLRKVATLNDLSKPRFVELQQNTGFGDERALLSVQLGNSVTIQFATLPPPTYLAALSREMKTC